MQLSVASVRLVNTVGHEFEGTATLAHGGHQYPFKVTAIDDGRSLEWNLLASSDDIAIAVLVGDTPTGSIQGGTPTIPWSAKGPFIGVVRRKMFDNCCSFGVSTTEPYYEVTMDHPFNLTASTGEDWEPPEANVRSIWLDDVKDGTLQEGARVEVMCSNGLDASVTGHQPPGTGCMHPRVLVIR
jgi:hypothetical protein